MISLRSIRFTKTLANLEHINISWKIILHKAAAIILKVLLCVFLWSECLHKHLVMNTFVSSTLIKTFKSTSCSFQIYIQQLNFLDDKVKISSVILSTVYLSSQEICGYGWFGSKGQISKGSKGLYICNYYEISSFFFCEWVAWIGQTFPHLFVSLMSSVLDRYYCVHNILL